MTLLITEIHVGTSMRDSVIFFGADRRISLLPQGSKKNVFHALNKKIFSIPYLNAGIGFFGLAEVRKLKGGKIVSTQRMAEWLSNFITRNNHITTLADFANALRDDLTTEIPLQDKRSGPSGFHISGFNAQDFPEFWFVSNNNAQYSVSEDFLNRDARANGFDGINETIPRSIRGIYRNGDYRGHVAVWDKADEIMKSLLQFSDFKTAFLITNNSLSGRSILCALNV